MGLTILPVRQERQAHKPYIILALLQVLDVLTTWFILSAWSVRGEANPLVASLIDNAGLNVGMLILLALKLGVVAIFWDSQTKVRLASAFYGLVIANNLLFLGIWLYSVMT